MCTSCIFYPEAISQDEMEKRDGWLTVCACSVNNAHPVLQAVAPGTAAAVSSARPRTGETAGVAPEEIDGETEQRKRGCWPHENRERSYTRSAKAHNSKQSKKPTTQIRPAISW